MAEIEQQLQVRINIFESTTISEASDSHFRAQMRSVRLFLREEVQAKKAAVLAAATPADEEAEYQRCSAINEEWNLEIAKIRNARVEKENAERRTYILQRVDDKKTRDREELEKIEARVRKEKKVAPTFITRETIDKAIDLALANPTEFNFSIDHQGNQYKEGEEKPGKPKEELEA